MMEYKGYRASVTFDDGAGGFFGTVVDTRDVMTFEGDSVEQLRREFKFSVDDYLNACREWGRDPDKPYSGEISFKVGSNVHRTADAAARSEGKTLEEWLAETMEWVAEQTLNPPSYTSPCCHDECCCD